MARIFLCRSKVTPENPWGDREYERLEELARLDTLRRHHLVDEAESADVVLFVGAACFDMWDVRHSLLRRRFRTKSFLISAGDRILPFLPGLYPSVEANWHCRNWTRSVCYLRVSLNQQAFDADEHNERRLLFSFRGNAATHPVRRELMTLGSDAGKLTDTGSGSYEAKNRVIYQDEIRDSKFVLCPRGGGVSSFRIFECLAMGRPPVIISDQWVPPEGPDWPTFSLRVKEREVSRIPEILLEHESNAVQMGLAARNAWDRYFSADVYFDYLVEQCLSMQVLQKSSKWAHLWALRQLLHPYYFRRCVLSPFRRLFK